MWKKIFIIIFLVSSICTYWVLKFGLKPKSVPIIRPSNFDSDKQLAEYIYRQMFQVFNENAIIVFGINQKSSFQLSVVAHLKSRVGVHKTYIVLDTQEAYHREPGSKILNLEVEYGKPLPAFIFEDLTFVREIPQLQDCSSDLRFHNWLSCWKENKLRQMKISKKVIWEQLTAVFERVAERDWVVFIHNPQPLEP